MGSKNQRQYVGDRSVRASWRGSAAGDAGRQALDFADASMSSGNNTNDIAEVDLHKRELARCDAEEEERLRGLSRNSPQIRTLERAGQRWMEDLHTMRFSIDTVGFSFTLAFQRPRLGVRQAGRQADLSKTSSPVQVLLQDYYSCTLTGKMGTLHLIRNFAGSLKLTCCNLYLRPPSLFPVLGTKAFVPERFNKDNPRKLTHFRIAPGAWP